MSLSGELLGPVPPCKWTDCRRNGCDGGATLHAPSSLEAGGADELEDEWLRAGWLLVALVASGMWSGGIDES